MLESLSPTKQSASGRLDSVYRYYAGYPPAFVNSLLDRLQVTDEDVVLDPWNGAGTTTAVCGARGVRSIGLDVNPFMRLVAEVRSLDPTMVVEKIRVLKEVLTAVPSGDVIGPPHILAARVLTRVESGGRIARDDVAALFTFASATRAIFQSVRTKNPTWYSAKRIETIASSESEIKTYAFAELDRLERWSSAQKNSPEAARTRPLLLCGDARSAWIGRRVDHIVTSPPYLTRIDYVKKTLPELSFLKEIYGLNIDTLRRQMIGTVLTKGEVECSSSSSLATAAIEAVAAHPSKASRTYYKRFFASYFAGLEQAIGNLLPLVAERGTATFVTQGSYYKEIYVDLPAIVKEMMESLGFHEYERSGFRSKNHMAAINSRTYASKQDAPEEVVSSFKR